MRHLSRVGLRVACWLLICSHPFWVLPGDAAENPTRRVYRDRLEPHWSADGNLFWYRVVGGSNAHEFVLVDAAKGIRRPAFDHAAVAAALLTNGFPETAAQRLPLDSIELTQDHATLKLRAKGRQWLLTHEPFELHPFTNTAAQGTPDKPTEVPARSTRTGEETSLEFINRSKTDVELFWLDSEGDRRSYGKLSAGQTRVQHTFEGHVWIALDAAGNVLGAFEASESGGLAEIGVSTNRLAKSANRSPRKAPVTGISPNGSWRVFAQDHNLFLSNCQSRLVMPLSKNGAPENAYSERIFWSPDSKRLVAMRTQKGEDRKVYLIESSPEDQIQPKLHSYDYPKPGDRISISKPHLFDVEARQETPLDDALFENPWTIEQIRWSQDSSEFTFIYNQRGHQALRVLGVNAQSGTIRIIVDERSATFIDYSGKQFVEYLEAPGSRELVWMSERDGWNHLYLYDIDLGKLKNQVTSGSWVVRGVERVDSALRQIWFTASGIIPGQDPYHLHLCRVNMDGTGLTVLTEGDGNHTTRFSPDRRYFIDTWSRVDLAPINELRDSRDGKRLCVLETADTNELAGAEWLLPERFSAPGRDGETQIHGIIHWPRNYDPGRKYPVVESIYAGPHSAHVPKSFQFRRDRGLADHGFAVVQIDAMGTSHRSKEFHDVAWQNIGDSGFPDRILWLRAAAAKYPALDLGRVGIYGTSAGGQSALRALLAHGELYKAAVADCGCHDNRMDKIWWNEQWMGWPVGPHYAEQSNVTQAHKLKGKLLLMVGELDKNVDPASTMQVVDALIKADKDFDLLVMPGMGHGVLGSRYAQRRMLEFFQEHLK